MTSRDVEDRIIWFTGLGMGGCIIMCLIFLMMVITGQVRDAERDKQQTLQQQEILARIEALPQEVHITVNQTENTTVNQPKCGWFSWNCNNKSQPDN